MIDDLFYHVLVMMAELNIPLEDVLAEMGQRNAAGKSAISERSTFPTTIRKLRNLNFL